MRKTVVFAVLLIAAMVGGVLLAQSRPPEGTISLDTTTEALSEDGISDADSTPSDEIDIDDDSPPQVTHGPMSGEATADSIVLWARGNHSGQMLFVISDGDSGQAIESGLVHIVAASDYIGKLRVSGLAPDTTYTYTAEMLSADQTSDSLSGEFTTAPDDNIPTPFTFLFSADIGGQNDCRGVESGLDIFDKLSDEAADFFLMTGDSVYVDNGCTEPDNLPGAEGPYTDLDGFRTRYRYTLGDSAYANFLAETPTYVTWDDHEIIDNFSGPELMGINPQLFFDGRQAFMEYWPLTGTPDDPHQIYRSVRYGKNAEIFILDTRSYRDPIVDHDPSPVTLTNKTMLGEAQFAWLQDGLAESDATWKFIVTSVPISYPTGFPQPQVEGRDSWANYTEPTGYEGEMTTLLFFIEAHDVENVVFLTGDVHFPFAMSYDPDRDGEPNVYEFGAGPLSAITLPPIENPDPSFNPTVLYAEGEFMGGLFNFGRIAVAGNGVLTFSVIDGQGEVHYSMTLQPE